MKIGLAIFTHKTIHNHSIKRYLVLDDDEKLLVPWKPLNPDTKKYVKSVQRMFSSYAKYYRYCIKNRLDYKFEEQLLQMINDDIE